MPTQAAPVFARGIGGKVMVYAAPSTAGVLGTTGEKEYAIVDWNFTKTSTLVEVTHSGSKGFSEYFPTKTEGSGSFNAIWDSTNIPDGVSTLNPTSFGSATDVNFGSDAGGQLEVGALVTLKLYLGETNKFYTFGARIESLAITVNATSDVVKFACNFKSNGVITDPTV